MSLARKSYLALFLAMTICTGSASAAFAAAPGTGGWCWPTGTENFGTMGGWWQARPGRWHLAQDMPLAAGKPVVAVGSGIVLESKYVGGYGPGGSQGGAVVILHRTATGKEFKALYGHLYDLRYQKGDAVAAGSTIGRINNSSPNHVHFGIHPGRAYPSDNNPFRGHTYISSNTYGWVDPVAFLRANPRVIPYVAPKLPVVMSLLTTSTPLASGVSSGVAFWAQSQLDTETLTWWRCSIASQTIEPVTAETTIPAYDVKRYVSIATSEPARLSVTDRMPVVTLGLSDTTPRWRNAVTLTGAVSNAGGTPFQGARVVIEKYSRGVWRTAATAITDAEGDYSARYTPASATRLRVSFVPPSTYTSATSPTALVTPHVGLGRPTLSTTQPRRSVSFSAISLIHPKRPASSTVMMQFERKAGSSWVRQSEKRATLSSVSDHTVCRVRYAPARVGDWRVRTRVVTSGYANTTSSWRYFSVK